MAFDGGVLFGSAFHGHLKDLVGRHHTLYPMIPPQGIYFESLVERAFLLAGWPATKSYWKIPTAPRRISSWARRDYR